MASTEPLRTGAAPGADKKLAHIVLQTGQLPVLREWYLKVLDADVVFENDMLSFMTFDEEHHRLAIVQLPQPAPRTSMTVGLAHSAYTFGSLDSLLTKYQALKEVGIQPHVPVQHGLTTSLYYRDPDAMLVALRAGTPESELITRAWALTCPQLNVFELLLT